MKQRVYIDMDGVLCEYKTSVSVSDMMQPNYYLHLAPRESMIEAVRELMRSDIADVYILSSVFAECRDQAIWEKNCWLDEYLPEINSSHRVFSLGGTNKADFVSSFSSSDILCDDHTPNLMKWVNAGGKGIKIINEVNGKNGRFQAGPRLKVNEPHELLATICAM